MSRTTVSRARTRLLLAQAFLALATWLVIAPAQAAEVFCDDASRHGPRLPGVRGTVWITDRASHRVLVYDAARLCVQATIDLQGGRNPIGIIGAGCDRIYVSNEDTNSISVISRQTLAVIKTIAIGPKPHHMHASADGRYVYVAEYGWHKVAAISTADDELIATSPLVASGNDKATTHAPWATADGGFVYTANQFPIVAGLDVPGEVGVIDAATGELREERVFGTQGKLPSEVLVTRNGRIAYVTLRGSGTVEAWETSPPRFLDTIDLNYEAGRSAEPDTIQLTPNGKQLIVALRQRIAPNATTVKGVALIDLRRNNAVTHVEMVATTTGHHWLTRNGRYSFVAIEGNPVAAAVIVDNKRAATVAYLPLPDSLPARPHGVYYETEPL